MAYSSLASKSIISPNYKKRTSEIDSISIQCPCCKISLDSMGEIFKSTKNKSSSHYGISNDGDIAVFVDEKNAAMSLSSTDADNRAITIQVSAQESVKPYPISDAAIQALEDLIVDICIRNNINELKWKDDKTYGQAAGHGGPVDEQNIFIHSWFSNTKTDPGEYLHDKISEIVQVANTQLIIKRENMRRVIFIGDTRTEALHKVIGTDLNLWFTKPDPACTWTGYSKFSFDSEINNRSAVCIFGGWNDPNYIKAKDYAEKLNSFYQTCVLRGCPVCYVSITPVSRTGNGTITNQQIVKFNTEMQQYLAYGIGYIDAYSAVQDSFIVTKGKDYDDNTNKIIYSTVIEQASRLTGGIRLNLNLNLDPTNFKPYIATFDRNANVDYKGLSDMRVVAAIIEAGYRFDTSGRRTQKFDNPNIDTQIEKLEKYEIPYGMYTLCRAKTIEDVKTEIQYFRYQLYRHPPKFGAWLHLLNMTGTKSQNDTLLSQYNESLTNLGFRGRMGIICTRKDLEKFSWDRWQDLFYLYLIDHLTDLEPLSNILDPELFNTDGTLSINGIT